MLGTEAPALQVTLESGITTEWRTLNGEYMPYLLKTEPDKYSFNDLVREGETVWDGIKSPQALITLRKMKPGEVCVIYHSNVGKAAVGLGERTAAARGAASGHAGGRRLCRVAAVSAVPPIGGAVDRRAVRLAGARASVKSGEPHPTAHG